MVQPILMFSNRIFFGTDLSFDSTIKDNATLPALYEILH